MSRGGVLHDHEIYMLARGGLPANEHAFAQCRPLIKPYNAEQLGPASYDIRLAALARVPRHGCDPIDLRQSPADQTMEVDLSVGYWLAPGEFVLGSSVEYVDIPDDLVCRVEGRSSMARLGLQIHAAGFVDPGYRGTITLEIVNFWPKPVRLWADVLIAQLAFETLIAPCQYPYGSSPYKDKTGQGRYQDSMGAVASRFGSERAAGLRGGGGDEDPSAPTQSRTCHFCGLEIGDDEKIIEAKTRNGWAHVTCWYDGGPFEREIVAKRAHTNYGLLGGMVPAERQQATVGRWGVTWSAEEVNAPSFGRMQD